MLEVLISFPFLFLSGRHLASAAFLDHFRDSGSQTRRGAQVQDFFGRGKRREQLQNSGGAIEAGLTTGVKLPQARSSGRLRVIDDICRNYSNFLGASGRPLQRQSSAVS